MKRSAIVLIVFCLVLIIAGIILCLVGNSMGDVFDNTVITDGDYVKTTQIDKNVKKIIVKYTDATVNVYGGAASDYIETVNIADDEIDLASASEITVSNKKDYITMAYDTVMQFSGLRNILFPGKSYTGEKTVNIYLSGELNMTQLNFSLESGDVNIKNLDSNTDYGVEITDTGNISVDTVSTKSNIDLTCASGNVSLNAVTCEHLTGSIGTGNLHAHEEKPGEHHYDLTCENGMVYLNEESQGSTFKVDNTLDAWRITFKVANGNIHISGIE